MIGKPARYQRTGIVLVAMLAALVIVLGWRAAALIGPLKDPGIDPAPAAATGKQFLVFRAYKVIDRGAEAWANDDSEEFEFIRFPIDGAAVPERLIHVTNTGVADRIGSPWMTKISRNVLFFDRRDAGSGSGGATWMDVSGTTIPVPDTDPDILRGGIPSPDGTVIAYADLDKHAVSVLTMTDGLTRSFSTEGLPDIGYLAPFAWHPGGRIAYLKPVFEGEAFVPGLWTLDIDAGEIREIEIVRELGLSNYSLAPDTHLLAGSTFECESLDRCGIGPSTLYLVDIRTEDAKELLTHDTLAFARPLISPDGGRIAFGQDSDVWLVEPNRPSAAYRLISGTALDWTPDGRRLVVDRNNELQIIDVATGAFTVVARRTGTYQDPDFRGIDYIGIVEKR